MSLNLTSSFQVGMILVPAYCSRCSRVVSVNFAVGSMWRRAPDRQKQHASGSPQPTTLPSSFLAQLACSQTLFVEISSRTAAYISLKRMFNSTQVFVEPRFITGVLNTANTHVRAPG